MRSRPFFSVVIPLYNKPDYIASAIRSVQAQSWTDFELIIIDDGSTDDSADRVMRFSNDPRLRLIPQSNRGVGAARNRGMTEAKGELFALLDADDEWLSGHLSNLYALARRFRTAGIVANGVISCGAKPKAINGSFRPVLLDAEQYFRLAALPENPIRFQTSSCAIRRSVFAENGGFLEGTPLGEDQEYWARICLHRPLAYSPEPGAVYRFVPGSAVNRDVPDGWYPPVVRTIKQYLARHENCANRRIVQDYAALILLRHIAGLLSNGKKSEASVLFQDEILKGCGWKSRIRRLRFGSRMPSPLLRAYVAMRG